MPAFVLLIVAQHYSLAEHRHVRLRCGPRGATTTEKLRWTKVWVPTPGLLRPAPGQMSGWVLGAGGGRPLPLWGSGGITIGKFFKTQMLNLAFWWLLAVKFLAFWKLQPKSWVPGNTLLVPNLEVGDQSPRSLRLLRLWVGHLRRSLMTGLTSLACAAWCPTQPSAAPGLSDTFPPTSPACPS